MNKNKKEKWIFMVFMLNEIRKQNGQSINDISEITGVAQSHVSRFFSAKFEPKISNFLIFAKAVKIDFFFESQESKTDLKLAMEKAIVSIHKSLLQNNHGYKREL